MDRPAKPSEVFDREAEWSSLVRFVTERSAGARLGVVSGRRRQGKTFLLDTLCQVSGGFYFAATEATEAESLRQLGAALAAHSGAPAPLALASWEHAIDALLGLSKEVPLPVVLDEFPYLVRATPALPSILQRALGPRRREQLESRVRLLLCGSALTFMGGLLSGNAPLRGRAGLELLVPTLDYRLAAQFWEITDPKLAVLTHAVVGGTPAYRREYARDDTPASLADFDDWVVRTVMDPASPLLREARYLLAEDPDLRDPALYHSVLAAVATGNATRGGIANYIGRKSTDISHHLHVLEDAGLLARDQDAFRAGRSTYRIAEPLVTFYQAIMRPAWARLERGAAKAVWASSRPRFLTQIVGPHFEEICRSWAARLAAPETFGGVASEVGRGVVNDPRRRMSHEVDVVVSGENADGSRRILSLGEAKWGERMGSSHVGRLRRVRELLVAQGLDAGEAKLACYGAGGFDSDLRAAEGGGEVLLVDLERLYGGA